MMDLQKKVQASDQDVFQYLSETNPTVQYPSVQIRELHTKDMSVMEQALAELHSGMSFVEVIHKYSSDFHSTQKDGLSDKFTINTRSPIGVSRGE